MKRILLIALLASLCQGCFVFDELDKSEQIVDHYSPAARKKAAQQEEAREASRSAHAGTKQEEGILEGLKKWWAKKREPAPARRDPKDVVVRCQIGGSTNFTRKSDCVLRGGRII